MVCLFILYYIVHGARFLVSIFDATFHTKTHFGTQLNEMDNKLDVLERFSRAYLD